MRVCRLAAVLACAMTLSITSAAARVLISDDNGGRMEDYADRFDRIRDSGDTVVIDGPCLSACTMVLGLVPRSRICATPNAVLGFHAAWEFDRRGGRIASPSGTRQLMRVYPGEVRAWIVRHGGLSPRMMFMRGRDLAAIVPSCDGGARSAALASVRGMRSMPPYDPRRASVAAR